VLGRNWGTEGWEGTNSIYALGWTVSVDKCQTMVIQT